MKNFLQFSAWRDYKWGEFSLICLYISLCSGVIVALQYDYTTPFYSTTSIDILVPFGQFFRSVHFFSSQLFFLLSAIHLLAVCNKSDRYTITTWIQLTAALPTIILLLFTGYILRGDATGSSAGMIAENIILTIPVIGSLLNEFLFSTSNTGLRKVYVHHVIGLDILLLMLIINHLRRYRVRVSSHQLLIAAILIFCMFFPAPLEPERIGVVYISGPWFFLGLQELLRYIEPLFAGVLIPLLFLVIMLFATLAKKHAKPWLLTLLLWLTTYAILTIIAWNR